MIDGTAAPQAVEARSQTSNLLQGLTNRLSGERVSLDDIVSALGDRTYGLLMFILAAPNCVPVPGPPGLTAIFGLPLCLIAAQLFLGRPRPWLPRWLLRRSMRRSSFDRIIEKVIPLLERFERLLGRRRAALTGVGVERALGATCFLMAVLLSLPLPVGTLFPALAIALIALALVEKDWGVAIAGVGIAVVSLLVVGGVIGAAVAATGAVLDRP